MERSPRTLIIALIAGLALTTLIFCGLMYILVGGQMTGLARQAFLGITLSLRDDDLNTPIGSDPDPVRFTVFSGDTASRVGERLQEQGFITDAGLFSDYVQYKKLDVALEAGTYFLNTTMTIRQIAVTLTDSRFSEIQFTVIPGQRIEEVAEQIDVNPYFTFTGVDFLAVAGQGAEISPDFALRTGIPAGASLEGFLYPDSYKLPPEVTPAMLRDILLEAFEAAVTDSMQQQAVTQGYTLYEVVTLASIVEREAIHKDEQALIAGVYRNRLEADTPWRLDADPTVQYAKGVPGEWWPRLYFSDYRSVISTYNTYLNYGMPPGPIASPGLAAIQAVINPMPSGYYFFRADCRTDGYHDFSVTFEEHLSKCP